MSRLSDSDNSINEGLKALSVLNSFIKDHKYV